MAANTRDIRRRIKSIRNTAQITKAMQMVAAAKMRRAQQAALAGRPYADLLSKVLVSLQENGNSAQHPLLEQRPVVNELVIVITSDKGLCGALNTNLLRELSQFDDTKTNYVGAGRKGVQFLSRTKRTLIADFPLGDSPTFAQTKAISRYCLEQFLAGKFDKLSVVYNRYVNTLVQAPTIRTLLPIAPEDVIAAGQANSTTGSEYLFEPDAKVVLGAILPYHVHFQVFQMVLNARASEHSARMVAMKNATDNAQTLVKDLTLEYNKIRQASITTELLEISTAQSTLG